MITLKIRAQGVCYPVYIARGILPAIGVHIRTVSGSKRVSLLTDSNVALLYLKDILSSLSGAGFNVSHMVIPPGESAKSHQTLLQIYRFLHENHITRTDPLVTLGGGVIGDLGGFAAATYLRGIPYVQVPTTLLAQIDSSVGGKTAVDLTEGKNMVGSFYHPLLVLTDTDTLLSLPDRIFTDGLGEAVKYACLYSPALFKMLEANPTRALLMPHAETLVKQCLIMKMRAVKKDSADTGSRMALNFGHTIGHAIEACQRYEGLRHGEAISVGMSLMTKLTEKKGMTAKGVSAKLDRLLELIRLPLTTQMDPSISEYIKGDKKHFGGFLHCVYLKRIGRYDVHVTDSSFLDEAFHG